VSKKILPVAGIANELEGASLFFAARDGTPIPSPISNSRAEPVEPNPPPACVPSPDLKTDEKSVNLSIQMDELASMHASKPASRPESSHASMPKSTPASMQDSTPASSIANKPDDFIEAIRRTVKQVGKEALFVRLSAHEKHQLSSLVYTFNEMYRGEGRKTSENEVSRVGLNWMLVNYQISGEHSILARVLASLNA
jgi:hypothetical protein